jgi:murein DD-endopeptidase MepM/ murein hydrolase activator NlpD
MRRSTPQTAVATPIPGKAYLMGPALAVLAVALAACGTTSKYAPREGYTPPPAREPARPNFPITQAPADQPVADAPPVNENGLTARPSGGPVTSQPLPPPPAAVEQQELPPPPPPPQANNSNYYATSPTPAPAPAPAYTSPAPTTTTSTTTVTSVSGRVVDVGGKPEIYVIKSGDTLISIARRMGVTQKELADGNDLEPPYNLRPGRTLKGPATKGKAYVVGSGDTLYAVARRFNVTAAALADENDIKSNANIRTGQRLVLPKGYRDGGPVRSTVTRTVPVTPSQTYAAETAAPPAYTPPASTPPAYTPVAAPQTVTTTSTEVSISGRVVEVAGKPTTYKVKSGDTLIGLADRLNTTQKQLIDDNDLKAPSYGLRIGQTLQGPATRAKAYVVGQGDTLRGVAQRFSVTTSALANANGIGTTSALRAGQRLTLPSTYRDTGPIRTTRTITATATPPRPAPTTVTTPSAPIPYRPGVPTTTTTTTTTAPPRPGAPPITTTTTTIRPVTPAPVASLPVDSPPLSDSDIAAAGRGRFTWPVRGTVISGFGPMGTGQRNDGLNVRAGAGDVVRAAAAGEVVYAGDQVPGFGNLILVKHDGGWVTAYAHLQRADVKMRQTVAQGQQIGMVGQSGGVPEPQLHFEVRYAPSAKDKARPIDPALVLPR